MAGETILNGRYALITQQGSGGMSVIYKATDRALGRPVAIKILRPSLTNDPQFLEKFRNEARSVARLSHPNIVTVHDVGSEGHKTHYIVMELIEGTDLKKVIKAYGALPLDRALNIAVQMCAGIGYAHRSGLVHADVKPQNILITPEDIVKVTDFGIAQALSDTQPRQRLDVVWGSPHYFAPEQAKGEQPTPAADVYAIGIVLFEMLTGQLPYAGANQQELAMAHIRAPIPSVTDINPTIPSSLASIIQKVMSKEPEQRYATADQLGNVLQKYQSRARDNTIVSPNVPPPAALQPPPAQQQETVPRPPSQPPQQNSGASAPVPPRRSSVHNEATDRYGLEPRAPQYDSRQQPSIPAPNSQSGYGQQPLQQGFNIPRAPQGSTGQQTRYPPPGDTSHYRAQFSQRMPAQRDDTKRNIDPLTVVLAIIAVLAFLGLIPLWMVVLLG